MEPMQLFATQKQRHLDLYHFSVCAEAVFCQKAISNFLVKRMWCHQIGKYRDWCTCGNAD